jgi:hypothetical protein
VASLGVLVADGVFEGPAVVVSKTASIVANGVLVATGGGKVGAPSRSRL